MNLSAYRLDALPRWAGASLILLAALALYLLVRSLLDRRVQNLTTRYYWLRGTGYVLTFLATVLVARMFLRDLTPVLTALGLVAAALTVVLKEVVLNLVGSVLIVWRSLFRFGDRVRVGQHRGDVVDMSLLYFTLLEVEGTEGAEQSTGRLVRVPNRRVITEAVTNYTQALPFNWAEIPFRFTLGSDLGRAEALLLQVATRHAEPVDTPETRFAEKMRRANIVYSKLSATVYTQVHQEAAHGSVRLTLRFLCRPRRRREVESAVTRDFLAALPAHPEIRLFGQP